MDDLAAACLGLRPGPIIAAWLDIPQGTFRRWVHEGHLTPKATGYRGTKYYDVGEAGRLAAQRGRLTKAS